MDELDARNVPYDKSSRKAELMSLLEQTNVEVSAEPVEEEQVEDEKPKLKIPEKRVTSRYPDEQERIDLGYTLIEENLDKSKTWLIKEIQRLDVPTSYIAKMLGAHYSFVHTVISNEGLDVVEKRTKSDEMREMFREGYSVSQVSKAMNAHYSYVHGVHKRWKEGGSK